MTASLNAATSLSHLASLRDTRELNAGSRNGESFSQVLRRTSRDQGASGPNRKGEAEKRDSKFTKKDDDANTIASVAGDGNVAVVEKSALPITFLFGLPAEQGAQSSGPENGTNAPSPSQIGGKDGNSDRSLQANLGVFPGESVALMTGAQSFTMPDKVDASPAEPNNPDLKVGSSGNNSRGAAGALSSNTLAFAMRLGSGDAMTASKASGFTEAVSSPASEGTPVNAGSAMPNMVQAASGSDLEEHAHQHDPSAQDRQIVELSAAPAPERFEATNITENNPAAPAAQFPADPAAPTAEPVRNMHMQLVSDDNRRVDVRLIDRGGELHVSVKSADPALTQSLQDHLPDLTARLDKQHMQSEVWVPKTPEPTKADAGSTNGSLSDPNARSYSGNSDGRKDGRQQERPDWVDALESYT